MFSYESAGGDRGLTKSALGSPPKYDLELGGGGYGNSALDDRGQGVAEHAETARAPRRKRRRYDFATPATWTIRCTCTATCSC